MNHPTSVLSYYPPNDSKFIDPMYVPYQDTTRRSADGCAVPVNTWPKGTTSDDYTPPGTTREGWYQDFLRLHPSDPCPPGWRDVGDGFCSKVHTSAHNGTFYTKDAFQAYYQYQAGYTVPRSDEKSMKKLERQTPVDALAQKSINPHTGNFVQYYSPRPTAAHRYNISPTRIGYLGK
jgi:hypothetical protein